MDNDRKSTVSSFYGGRRSGDALNTDFHLPPGAARPRGDSTSSFYGLDGAGNRYSRADPFDTPTAGYNQGSYVAPGRTEPVKGGGDEEAAWDVYADFNNAGPRYSTAFGMGDNGYRQVPSPTPYSPGSAGFTKGSAASVAGEQTLGGNVEMVTVPALGPEWKAEELRGMSKKAKREDKIENLSTKWKKWTRGETGLCGSYFTRRFTAWFAFGLCVAVALILAFTIPRVPSFSLNQAEPLSPATNPFNKTIPAEFSRSPANFSFPGLMQLQADTGSNYLPLTFKNIHGTVFDLTTERPVATGDTGHLTLPAHSLPVFNLNLNFTYAAVNDSDATWNNWYNACRNKAIYTNNERPAVQFRLVLDMNIVGLIGTKSASTQVNDAACPIELPLNSV
ncbi:hypothetical protein K466DRAFT_583221 [Polyporus arcularius HHB13444]|uniref:Uncharacterized protein n=1 Tax=Polyporus arcularius HHB13444 TaxID=1314778 RepID=A0A5C3PN79_9APHY|nr:hypothetical protein K466DRAFT_583221 [Polyporus arcularius HHB13444]